MRRPGSIRLSTCVAAVLLALFGWVCEATADQFTASHDNTIYSESDSSFGGGRCIQVGRTGPLSTIFGGLDSTALRRGLIRFDLAPIPAGSQVVSAKLTLFRTGGLIPQLVSVHKLRRDWGEGSSGSGEACNPRPPTPEAGRPPTDSSSTWNFRYFGARAQWDSAGGDFEPTLTDSVTMFANFAAVELSGPGIAADVQSWVNNPVSNDGWILIGDEAREQTGSRFASREDPIPAHRPTLTISFTSPPTGACCTPDGRCNLLTRRQCNDVSGVYAGDSTTCTDQVCLEPYVDWLPIPPVAVPKRGRAGGVAFYDITMRQFQQKLHRDLPPTTLWGYDGMYPGPTIEAFRNQPVHVRWINDLRDSTGLPLTDGYFGTDTNIHGPDALGRVPRTVVHLHGAHVPPDYDGYPESTFVCGESRQYHYPNTQLPTTLWYHDHALGLTRYNVMMGLAGFYLIRDQDEEALGLPRAAYEIPLLIQDRNFDPKTGSLQYPSTWQQAPFLGDEVLVNGKIWPKLHVDQGKYRIRILNGSNHRIFTLTLSDGHKFYVIGSDGGLLTAPVEVDKISLGPAERAELVLDFAGYAAGSEVLLKDTLESGQMTPSESHSRVMKFVVSGSQGWTTPLPASLHYVDRIPESEATRTRTFELRFDQSLGKFRFGDFGWSDTTEFPVLGTTEIWQFANRTNETHPIHIHLVQFQVLDRSTPQVVDGQIVPGPDRTPPDPAEAGWKDTAKVKPNQLLRVIMRFGPNGFLGNFVFHCHMLEHEDNDMMRQFTVLPPGRAKPTTATAKAVPARLWPPDLSMVPVNIVGVTDSMGNAVSVHVTGVTQDEPISHRARGGTMLPGQAIAGSGMMMSQDSMDNPCFDARVVNGQLFLRRERQEGGNGRVYRVSFTAVTRDGGSADGTVLIGVPRQEGVRLAVNDGLKYNALEGCPAPGGNMSMAMHSESAKTFSTSLGVARVEAGRVAVDYTLAQAGKVSLAVFDVAGRRVASLDDAVQGAGEHHASLAIEHLAHGIYFVRMRVAGKVYTHRMPVLKNG